MLALDGDLEVEKLSSWLDDRLARFKHPKDLVFLDELPRNASGKVVKDVLRRHRPWGQTPRQPLASYTQ